MSQEVEVLIEPGIRRWKRPILIAAMMLLAVCGFIYVVQPQYPLNRPNRTPGRPWSAWDAADHEVDGKLSREEMERFSKQQPHRDVEQLLPNVAQSFRLDDAIRAFVASKCSLAEAAETAWDSKEKSLAP